VKFAQCTLVVAIRSETQWIAARGRFRWPQLRKRNVSASLSTAAASWKLYSLSRYFWLLLELAIAGTVEMCAGLPSFFSRFHR
jgi:hypothetical protein